MWKHLLFSAAILAWTASSQGQEFLTTVDGWEFFKVPSPGVMSNTNVKATCEAAGMSYPCYDVSETCDHGRHWTAGCISFNVDGGHLSCHTPTVLSLALCGHTIPRFCQQLDDTFVYNPGSWSGDSAYGTDFQTASNLFGAFHHDKIALCAVDPTSAPSATDVPKVTDVTEVPDAPSVTDVPKVTDGTDRPDVTDVPKVTDVTDGFDITDGYDVTDGHDVTDGNDITDVPNVTDGPDGPNDVITG
ncbi:Hypp1823 [Branchiostoma lanceolatum]|uniref:Hypp1823 protein n=1 Tax=Branchiostoma lanceolatum TaxID=7740 RepID=A0A8J9ZKV2_BRALA|nr:Hypp1823 [Branchiostoma lanceolatum]